jgi:hypothetical protein
MKKFNSIITLRRDNDYNYRKVENTFIPHNGEVCLVDTAKSGLRVVIGDGKTPFGKLDFYDGALLKGYYFDNSFYKDKAKTESYPNLTTKIYLDYTTNSFYYYDEEKYIKISGGNITATDASPTNAGIMKLYNSTGSNTDGTMTQKAISDELDDKVEIALDTDEELLIFIHE